MDYEKLLKKWITDTQERFNSYRELIKNVYDNKHIWEPTDEETIEYLSSLKRAKNSEEKILKKLQQEMTNFRQGL